eukprot:gene1120-3954_t
MASLMASSSSSLLSARRSRAVVGPARRAAVAPVSGRKASRGVAPCFAMIRQYPDPDFMAQVAKDFPEMGVAEPDEVRCLLAQGWTWLDVRPTLEYEDAGKTKGSVNIPIKNSKKKFVDGKKTFEKTPNPDWLAMVQKKFPCKDPKITIGCSEGQTHSMCVSCPWSLTHALIPSIRIDPPQYSTICTIKSARRVHQKRQKIMIGCSDGQAYSIDALEALDEAGYVNLVGVAGGYYEWFR